MGCSINKTEDVAVPRAYTRKKTVSELMLEEDMSGEISPDGSPRVLKRMFMT